jgi:hypothetical protein
MSKLSILVLMLVCLVAPAAAMRPFEVDTTARVVAFGDVHGAYDDLVQMLQEAGVIDSATNWSGGDTQLVSLGDLIDRGADSRKVVELLIKLDKQSLKAGGALHLVLGNHEIMVMSGDVSYVSAAEFAAFADDEKNSERKRALKAFTAANPELDASAALARFDQDYPPGYFALQRAFSADGDLGAWLQQMPLVLRVNDTVYMHGGASTEIAEKSLATINGDNKREFLRYLELVAELRKEGVLASYVGFYERRAYLNNQVNLVMASKPEKRPAWFDLYAEMAELEGAFIFSRQSPVWYRGSAFCHPLAESFNTERLLKRAGASRLVIGHTPSRGEAIERQGGQIIRLDTGMLKSVYQGRAAVLVQEAGQRYVQYLGEPQRQQPIIEDINLSPAMWGMTDAEMEDFLLRGDIVEVVDIGTGITKPQRVSLRRGEREGYAVFKHVDSVPGLESKSKYLERRHNRADRFQFDVAAYKLDRMMDLQLVPVTVLRAIDGEKGALGAWFTDTINERDRSESGEAFKSYCPQIEQYRLRFVFDILAFNEDRNLNNILWSKRDFMMRLIDHSLAFRTMEKRPKQYAKVGLRVSDLLREQLEGLTQEQLQTSLADYLHARQIEAIIGRRDLILREALGTDP